MDRFELKVFAGTLDSDNKIQTGQFGSFVAQGGIVGVSGVLSDNPTTLQALPAWGIGWKPASNDSEVKPRWEEFNALFNVLTKYNLYNQYDGITYWQSYLQPTANQSIVQYQTGNNAPCLYYNKTGTNTSTAPDTDTTNWQLSIDLSKDYVDTTTSQTIISGTKTFGNNSRLTLQDNAALNVNLVNTSFNWTATSSTQTKLSETQTKDANGVVCSSLSTYAGSRNERSVILQVNKPDGTEGAYVQAYYNTALGVGYGVAPTPPAGAYGNEIVTAAWVKGVSAIPKLNWNAITSIPIPWTVDNYGIVLINATAIEGLIGFECNGSSFARSAGVTYGTRCSGNIIVKPGDSIQFIGNANIEQASFIPFA